MAEKFEFSRDDVRLRFNDHLTLAENYCADFETSFNVALAIDTRCLYLAIISAYKDIERFKNFHLDDPFKDKSDAVKRAAYLTKWLCRFKPIKLRDYDAIEELDNINIDQATLINEMFSIHVAFTHLSVDAGRDFSLAPNGAYDLVYTLLFRNVHEDSLMVLFQALTTLARDERIIIIS